MKQLFALILGCLFLCCAPASKPPTVVARLAYREFAIALHADVDFTSRGRDALLLAASKWREASAGRIRIDVIFDVDFSSTSGLRDHQTSRHSVVLGLLSEYPIVERIDEAFGGPGSWPLGVTILQPSEPTTVFLVMDRIREQLLSVATHEFGHVAGLDDLQAFGSVMSGVRLKGSPSVDDLTEADIELCRAAQYCL